MTYDQIAKRSVGHERGAKHEEGDLVMWSNGVIARVRADGRHTIIRSSPEAAVAARQVPRYSKALGAKAAARAFNKYYAQKARTMSPRSLKAAMTRDLCHSKKEKYQRRTTAYKATREGRLTGPGNYDYPGLDDGSRCPQRGGARCGVNPATNRCAKGFDNKEGWCELGGKKGTRKSPNRNRRCVASPFARRFMGMPKARKSPRRSKRIARKAAKKSPKKAAKKSPKKARKSPKKPPKNPLKRKEKKS